MYTIKTLKGTEAQALWRMMGLYAQHMLRNSKRTLFSRICSLYGMQMVNMVRPGKDNIPHQIVPAWTKSGLLAQLQEDLRLLERCGVMDYSLLVGAVDMEGHASH